MIENILNVLHDTELYKLKNKIYVAIGEKV